MHSLQGIEIRGSPVEIPGRNERDRIQLRTLLQYCTLLLQDEAARALIKAYCGNYRKGSQGAPRTGSGVQRRGTGSEERGKHASLKRNCFDRGF